MSNLIPGTGVTVHTKYRVLMTSYPWPLSGTRPFWTRRYPAWKNGVVERGAQPYGQQVATWCNNYRVSYLSGFYTVQSPVFQNFQSSLWNPLTNLGALKLVHMFDVNANFLSQATTIENTIVAWGTQYMQNAKYGRIRLQNGERPLLLFWSTHAAVFSDRFCAMIASIRNRLRPLNPFIIGTEHIANAATGGNPAAVAALNAIDGFYHHEGGLPWQRNLQWNGVQSLTKLNTNLASLSQLSQRYNKPFFPGTMPRFDRDLFTQWREGHLADQGRVVITESLQLTNLLKAVRNYAPVMYSEEVEQSDGLHIYEDRWVILTSLNEWEEGQTYEPCLVRTAKYDPNTFYEYGTDSLQAVADVFRDRVTRTSSFLSAATSEAAAP